MSADTEEDPDTERVRLEEALRAAAAAGVATRVIAAHVELGLHLGRIGELVGLTEHFDHAAELFAQLPRGSEPDLAATLGDLLGHAAFTLNYDAQQPELAVRLASRVTQLASDDPDGWRILGNGLLHLGRWQGAADAYTRVADLARDDAGARSNLAAALVNLERYPDALRVLDDALALAPHHTQALLMRGQLRAQAGDAVGGAADLVATIDQLTADRPPQDVSADGQRRYREHWRTWATAFHKLVELQRSRDDRSGLESTARRLIATGDDALGAIGHRLRGELARADGRLAEARTEYDAAIASFALDHEARLERSQVAAELGDIDAAVADLAALAPRDRAPKCAIAGLVELRKRTDRPDILRWLGFAQFEIFDLDGADANLDAYLQRLPDDVEARRWFGLALISAAPDDRERASDVRRLFRGLEELARSAAGGDAEGRDAFLWLLDRLLVGDRFLWPIGGSKPIAVALPCVPELLDALSDAQNLVHSGRDWAAGIEVIERAVATASGAGLKCFAAYLHVLLADWELLRGGVAAAAQHARAGMQLARLSMTPLSAGARAQFASMRGVDPRAGDIGLEIEHVHIYNLLFDGLLDARFTMARVLAHAGDSDGTLAVIGDMPTFIADADHRSARTAKVVAEILRDLGRTDDALGVLARAEPRAESDDVRAAILTTRATILARLGRLPEAHRDLEQAVPLLDETRRWIVTLNLASYVQASGHDAEALEMLAGVEIDDVARSDEDRFGYLHLRAAALAGLGRHAEARDVAMQAIQILENLRVQLKDLDLRAAWTGKQEALYALAVRVTAANGDTDLAFDLCERARSRQLVDEIAIGPAILDGQVRALAQQLRDAEAKRDVLMSLERHGRSPALVLRLRELDPDLNVLEIGEDGRDRLSVPVVARALARTDAVAKSLRRELAERRAATAERMFGAVVDGERVRELLRGFP